MNLITITKYGIAYLRFIIINRLDGKPLKIFLSVVFEKAIIFFAKKMILARISDLSGD